MGAEKNHTNGEENKVNPSGDALLRHDFDIVEADQNREMTNNGNILVEFIKGWKPISHRAKDLTVEYFRKLRARALPPRRTIL